MVNRRLECRAEQSASERSAGDGAALRTHRSERQPAPATWTHRVDPTRNTNIPKPNAVSDFLRNMGTKNRTGLGRFFFAKKFPDSSGRYIAHLSCPVQTSVEQKATKATKRESRTLSGGQTRHGKLRIVSTTAGRSRPASRLLKTAEALRRLWSTVRSTPGGDSAARVGSGGEVGEPPGATTSPSEIALPLPTTVPFDVYPLRS